MKLMQVIDNIGGGRGIRILAQCVENALGLAPGHLSRHFLDAQLAEACHAAESSQQLLRGALADAGNFRERRSQPSAGSPLPVKRHGKAVRFVANLLDQV